MLVMMNACRASNIQNLTLDDMDKSTVEKEFPTFKIINQTRYKTSFVYGIKAIVIPADLFGQLETYVRKIRPILVKDREIVNGKTMKPFYRYVDFILLL